MNLLEAFRDYLLHLRQQPTPATVKNYCADIRQFVLWFEKTYEKPFSADDVNPVMLKTYQQEKHIAQISFDRHLSSLRKFYIFLNKTNRAAVFPFVVKVNKDRAGDMFHLREFKNYLYTTNRSHLTTKNYIVDIQQFLQWADRATGSNNAWQAHDKHLLPKITTHLVEEYKLRLLEENVLSPTSINRKLSSLRKYLSWASEYNYIPAENTRGSILNISKSNIIDPDVFISTFSEQIQQEPQVRSVPLSRFPPLRLAQKLKRFSVAMFDTLLILPLVSITRRTENVFWKIKGKPLFVSPEAPQDMKPRQESFMLKNISKSFYAPYDISTRDFPLHKKLIHHARYTRPVWYRKYRASAVVQYFHYLTIMLLFSALALAGYKGFLQKNPNNQPAYASLESAPRLLTFRGTLSAPDGLPLTTPTSVRFTLYNDEVASGSSLLWQEVEEINPNQDGQFTAYLGSTTELPSSVFSENPSVWVGVTIGTGSETVPRKMLPTTEFAASAGSVEGLLPITNPAAGTKNTLLALDSSGNLTIGGGASPVFQAIAGDFTIKGDSVIVTSNRGSNGNVTLSPDGFGYIDLQKPLKNTSDYGNIPTAGGSVEIDDTLAVLATTSAESAFTINQNGLADLISASVSGTPKFTVKNDGSGYFAGNLGIGVSTPAQALDVLGNIQLQNMGRSMFSYLPNTLQIGGGRTSGEAGNLVFGNGSGWKFFIGKASDNAATKFVTVQDNGNVGIGSTAPSYRLDVSDSQSSTYAAMITNTSVGAGAGVLGLRLSGIATPASSNYWVGFYNANGMVQGKIKGNPTTNTVAYDTNGGDFAEYFKKADASESFQAGDLVCTSALSGVTKCDGRSVNILGVVSDQAGFVGAGNHENDSSYVLVGLVGQLPVKINPAEAINPADPITASTFAGVSTRATNPGQIIGRSLQKHTSFDGKSSILVSISPSWYDPAIVLTKSGDLTIQQSNNITMQQSITDTIAQLLNGYIVKTASGEILNRLGAFSDLVFATARAGFIRAESASIKTLTALQANIDTLQAQTIISPIARIDRLATGFISPLASDSHIGIGLSNSAVEIKSDTSTTSATVATINNKGNARFAGDLEARRANFQGSLSSASLKTNEATIAGILRAGRIIADQIDLPDNASLGKAGGNPLYNSIATPAAQTVESSMFHVASVNPTPSPSHDSSYVLPATDFVTIATFSSQLAYVEDLHSKTARFEEGLLSFGPTSLADTSITGQLSIGSQLVLSDNSINVLGADLQLQPLKQGGVSIAAGQVYIDSDGNITVGGNAEFAKNVRIKGTLAASILNPLPDEDLVINLGTKGANGTQETHDQSLIVKNASGSAVFAVSATGDVSASGSGTFASVQSQTTTTNKLNFSFIQQAEAVSEIVQTATGSAGIASIQAYQKELTIKDPLVSDKSLIYITPTTDTNNIVLYLLRQVPGESFTVGINTGSSKEIPFNWLIVN